MVVEFCPCFYFFPTWLSPWSGLQIPGAPIFIHLLFRQHLNCQHQQKVSLSPCCKLQVGWMGCLGCWAKQTDHKSTCCYPYLRKYFQKQYVADEVKLRDEIGRNWSSWDKAEPGGKDWGTLSGEFLWSAFTTIFKMFTVFRTSIQIPLKLSLAWQFWCLDHWWEGRTSEGEEGGAA